MSPASSPAWSIERSAEFEKYTVQWADREGRLIVSLGAHLYMSKPDEALWHLATLPMPWWQTALSTVRAAVFTQGPTDAFDTVLPLSGRATLLTHGSNISVMRDGIVRPLPGLARPTRLRRGSHGVTAQGLIYFGEDIDNRHRGPVHVYRFNPTASRAEIAYTFPKHSIRRVRAVRADPRDDSLWCLTGDSRGECRIVRTDDCFGTVEVLGAGDDTWHAATLQFLGGRAYYATAAERLCNKVFRLDGASGQRDELGEVGGPVHDSVALGDDLFFAVTGKACGSNPSGEAALWHLDAQLGLRKIFSAPPQTAPTTLQLAHADGDTDTFWFSTSGPGGGGRQTYRVNRRPPRTSV